ncbi:hypothetical protein Nepgr_009561 [Nepenthes gracilis]|uniref:Uncharacterized protein n=1 Tax=Nepenthes gracilis TaxID=150966 RepID=A0AAD3SB92_NEPGR|nr:hypothetical protein Nepgr_009561 [Nepenthes gracilis]
MSLVTEETRAKATVYYGDKVCQEQTQRLLREVGLPDGLLPLQDVVECGHVAETGFVWLKQKKKTEHKFEKVGRLVSYATEVTAYAEPCKIKNLTGIKVKELMIWLSISDVTVQRLQGDIVTFRANSGLTRTFPAAAFMIEGKDVTDDGERSGMKATA